MCPKVEDEMKVQALFAVWAFTILCLVSYTAAFSHGASLSACASMRPKHIRANLQNPQNHYITIHTNMSFFPGEKVPVTVRSTRDFMGFMLQARRVSNDQIAGTFVYIPPGSKLLTCFEDGDTVTHSDKSLKRNLSFVWKAPDQPIGDIRFFLSVVQSYFVYWARIESSTVSQQTQNGSTPVSSVAAGTTKPTTLQKPTDVIGEFTVRKGSTPYITVTQYTSLTPTSLTRSAATLNLDPIYSGPQVSERPGNGNPLPESLPNSSLPHAISQSGGRQANGSGTDNGLTLEPSLSFRDLGFQAAQDSSSDRTENSSSAAKSLVCLTCKASVEEVSGMPNLGVNSSAPPITASLVVHLWDTQLLSGIRTMSGPVDSEEDVAHRLSADAMRLVEKPSATQTVPANFLPQAELTAHGPGKESNEGISGNEPLKVTRVIPKAALPEEGGQKPGRGSRLVAAQLSVLLGGSAILGMILAIGLRCIHSQYCHKRTEVSFSEPDNNVIALRESGEMMHFRKIRENSFVLVQAEYNWISPSGSGTKAVI
ncbi:hypothetical protein lerEdw1_012247 [Lerista edwardsae]|nr:hypothetical protein lerEdw1_012247 [Lerista edwardsae]